MGFNEKSFGCKVFSYYGNTERCGFIAQCEKGNLHLKLQHSYVELIKDRNTLKTSGKEGRIVCTNFGNYATTFIRYDVGDLIKLSGNRNCICKKGGILVENIMGRTDDYIITPEGRLVGRLGFLFHDEINVKTFVQITSENPAKRFKLNLKGSIQENYFADLIIIEKVKNYAINPQNFVTKAKFTPFENTNLSDRLTSAKIWKVFLRGNEIYPKLSEPSGKIILSAK